MINHFLYLIPFADIIPPEVPIEPANDNTMLIVAYSALFLMNLLAFTLYAYDKHLACGQFTRIPEAALLATAILGGPYGAAMAMILCRHKTQKLAFRVVVPVSLIIWVALIFWLYLK